MRASAHTYTHMQVGNRFCVPSIHEHGCGHAVVQARSHTYICRAMQYDPDAEDSTVLNTKYGMYHVTQKTRLGTESIQY